jgi:hypothetical protein
MDETAPSKGVGLGGCGNKCKTLIEDVCDAYITSGLSYWDIAACEPLVRARGGTVFLGNMDKIVYYDGNVHIKLKATIFTLPDATRIAIGSGPASYTITSETLGTINPLQTTVYFCWTYVPY